MKTDMVVLRDVNPNLIIWNFALNPKKWARVKPHQIVSLKSWFCLGPIYSLRWDPELIRALRPEVYVFWLNLRALELEHRFGRKSDPDYQIPTTFSDYLTDRSCYAPQGELTCELELLLDAHIARGSESYSQRVNESLARLEYLESVTDSYRAALRMGLMPYGDQQKAGPLAIATKRGVISMSGRSLVCKSASDALL